MKSSVSISILLSLFVALAACGCKAVSKKVLKESLEEGTESVVRKKGGRIAASESGIIGRTLERSAGHMDWNAFLKAMEKDNVVLFKSIKRLDTPLQRQLGKAVESDPAFFRALTGSPSILDEFAVFCEQSPAAARDIHFLRFFAVARAEAREAGKGMGDLSRFVLKESDGRIRVVSTLTGESLAEFKDGIIRVSRPFMKGETTLAETSLLKQPHLLPGCIYRLDGANGTKYLFQVDDFGRVTSVDAKCISPDALEANILHRTDGLSLGEEWNKEFRKLKQHSHGDDLDVQCVFKYSEEGAVSYVNVKAERRGKAVLDRTFKALAADQQNRKTVDRFARKLGISSQKQASLLREMSEDAELAKLINNQPEFNIPRWLKAHNHVDEHLIVRTPKGEFPINARTYAGNVYYFNPHLNPGLKARLRRGNGMVNLRGLSSLSYDDLLRLDARYPDGVPWSKSGFPDFRGIAARDAKGNPILIDIGKLSGDSKKDISVAETLFQQQGNAWEYGYTWHHVENTTTLLRVPTQLHQLVDHTGGMSMSRSAL